MKVSMRATAMGLLSFATVSLAGCGQSSPVEAASAAPSVPEKAPERKGPNVEEPAKASGGASAMSLAEFTSTPVQIGTDCPAPPTAGARPRPGPDDVMGIRLGMTPGEALTALRCSGKSYEVSRSSGDITTKSGKTSKMVRLNAHAGPYLVQPGADEEDRLQLTFGGPTGGEVLVLIHRKLDFAADQRKSVPAMIAELNAKYGQFTDYGPRTEENLEGTIVYAGDPLKPRAIRPRHVPDPCTNAVVDGSVGIGILYQLVEETHECRLTINYYLRPTKEASPMVERLRLAIGDPAFTIATFDAAAQ